MKLLTYDDILELLKRGAVVEAQEQFTALHGAATLRQLQISARSDQVHSHSMTTGLVQDGQLKSDGIAYYRVDNGKKTGPYCQRCYDAESRLEKMRAMDAATYLCCACKTQCPRNLCG